MATKNVKDLSLETRQAIADKAKAAWMTAEQVSTQLKKVWVNAPLPIQQTPEQIAAKTEAVNQNAPTQTTQAPVWFEPIDTQTGAPVQAKAPEVWWAWVIWPQETIKQEPIKTTPTTIPKTEDTAIQAPISIEDWKAKWSTVPWLEQLLESKYNTTVTNENWVLKGNIWWVDYQWTIDSAWNPIKTKAWWENAQDIFSQLMMWQTLPETWVKTTPAYSKAKSRYDIANKYIWMTEDQLYSAYVNWEIWASLEKDLATNPALAIAKEKYNKKLVTDNINKESSIMLNSYNKANGIWTTQEVEKTALEKLSEKFLTMFEDMWKTNTEVATFKDYMADNYPDIVNDSKELNAKSLQVKKLADERDARLENIIKENPWISINRANMLAARQNKDINEQIKSMSYEIANLSANINYQTSLADKEYSYEQDRLAKQEAIAQEQRGYAFNLLNTAQAQQFAQQQTADQRAYEQANAWVKTQIITDPATWQQALINSSTWETIKVYDTGLKTDSMTAQQKAQYDLDVKKFWLEQAKFNLEAWIKAPVTPTWNIWSISYTNANWTTKNINVDNVASPSLLTAFNAMWDSAIVWNWYRTKEEQQKLYDAYQAWTGWLAAAPWTSKHETWMAIDLYGWTDKNGKLLPPTAEQVKIMKENWWEQTAWEEDLGHFEYVWATTKSGISQAAQDWGQNILQGRAKLSDISWDPELKTEVSSYLASNKPSYNQDSPVIRWLQESLDTMTWIVDWKKWGAWFLWNDTVNESLAEDVSGWFQLSPLDSLTWEKWQFLRKIQFILDDQTLQNLIDIKAQGWTFGALSEKELSILQKSASLLNSAANRNDKWDVTWFTMSEKEFKTELEKLVTHYDNTIKSFLKDSWTTWWTTNTPENDPLGLF